MSFLPSLPSLCGIDTKGHSELRAHPGVALQDPELLQSGMSSVDTEQVLLLCLLSDLSDALAVSEKGVKGPQCATKASYKHLSWETKTQSTDQMPKNQQKAAGEAMSP